MSLEINYIFRKRLPQYNSIEELFGTLITYIKKECNVEVTELSSGGASLKNILINLRGFKNKSKSIVHITGDVHYMALVTGRYTVLTIHDVKSIIKGSILKQQLIKLLWFWLPALFVKKITVISEFSRHELIPVIPFAKHKIHVVYNPVNVNLQYTPKDFNSNKPNVLLVGTKPNKNLELTLEAIEGVNCTVTIIGKLSEEQLALLRAFNIDFTNKFNIPYAEIVQAYSDCDVLVFASTYEGFGMPIIEAQTIGRPIITSNIGAMKEVAGNGAILINPRLKQEITKALKDVIEDDNLREKLINQGLENVKRFQLDKIANDYMSIYKTVLNE
ncbi:glycosyltransferase family 4 protein [Formosa sediminum]|uniref:Glycosyltransferase family 4 protein n=1 Tax=Formosa sediminum TaxID=2594004 RepID=A0A516GQ95_9FLAO|nr:glycosyltransferase family 1 protein [Formosa sediminum]QDO93701.1 glycosyltransferase family 4 protein [Formosa sediminum]